MKNPIWEVFYGAWHKETRKQRSTWQQNTEWHYRNYSEGKTERGKRWTQRSRQRTVHRKENVWLPPKKCWVTSEMLICTWVKHPLPSMYCAVHHSQGPGGRSALRQQLGTATSDSGTMSTSVLQNQQFNPSWKKKVELKLFSYPCFAEIHFLVAEVQLQNS